MSDYEDVNPIPGIPKHPIEPTWVTFHPSARDTCSGPKLECMPMLQVQKAYWIPMGVPHY